MKEQSTNQQCTERRIGIEIDQLSNSSDTRPLKRSRLEPTVDNDLLSSVTNGPTTRGLPIISNLPLPHYNNYNSIFNKVCSIGSETPQFTTTSRATSVLPTAQILTPESSSKQQEIVDLTSDNSDDDCVIDEEETNRNLCWGMIKSLVLVLYPRPSCSGQGEEEVELRREGTRLKNQAVIRVTKNGDSFGVVEQELANVLAPLMDENLVWTEASIPKNLSSSEMMIPLHIVLYGRPGNTEIVSTHLAERKVYLTDPIVYNVATRYSNPHNSPHGCISQLNKNGNNQYRGYQGSYGNTTTMSPEEMKNQIDKVFNSLMNAENIPEAQPDPRLITPLYKHQKQALYFLLEREKYNDFTNDETNALTSLWRTGTSAGRHTVYYNVITNKETSEKPQMRGGIVADDMGLGKTIQILALILSTQNEALNFCQNSDEICFSKTTIETTSTLDSHITVSNHNLSNKSHSSSIFSNQDHLIRSRGTLIICPLSAVSNWEEQLSSHVQEGALSLYVYHGGSRISDPSLLVNYDIVITTYNVSGTEYSKQSRENSSIPSALQKINWFRIVLDEAHIIRDVNTVQSKAAHSLTAERRWCLTGTPIQNKVDDLFALIKFLHMHPFDEKDKWNYYISRPIKSIDLVGISRLQILMKCITLRRTKVHDGKPLLSLPPRNFYIRYLELNEYERKLYDKIYCSQAEQFKRLEQQNNIMQHYVSILQSILRLRQICAHFALVKESELLDDFGDKPVSDGLTHARGMILLNLVRENGMDQCGSCMQELAQTSIVTKCEHLFCMECATKVMGDILVSTNSITNSCKSPAFVACPSCEHILGTSDVLEINDSKNFENNYQLRADREKNIHSTKVEALVTDLLQAKVDGIKSVVFSQWTRMLDLIEDALKEKNILFTRLDGTMTRAERTHNMDVFKRKFDVSVILVSLKAGCVGLNLTSAQRVYLMDPFWNPSVESQAIDRIHRLGQTSPVDIIKFIIRNSVEEGILERQRRKLELAKLTLSKKLSKEEIAKRRLEDLKILFK
ncbi:SNF2 family N-terminal domain-containing protein [Gigaspora margarita]|uniref:SNF2 family N-terminal domain-containing protein n=1 Tax=Gigaspora margarita TaxID=4874 RepID=A0A8H4EQC8_GIGMA|nr:SNF2 family N-terminal domain-containing protein [Gigaspora margarita]